MQVPDYLRSVFLCDDIRIENTGREIAIGIFPGILSFPRLPVVIQALVVRFELFFAGVPQEVFSIRIVDPSKNVLVEQKMALQFGDWSMPGSAIASFQGFIFPAKGTYEVLTATSGEEWARAYSFVVEQIDPSVVKQRFTEFMRKVQDNAEKNAKLMSADGAS
jgi:hypothetical protein